MTSTTKTTKPRAPQDRKPKQSDLLAAEAAEAMPAGAEHLKLAALPAWDQADAISAITELFQDMGIDVDAAVKAAGDEDADEVAVDTGIDLTSANIKTMGKLVRLLLDYAEDTEAFTTAVSGPGGLVRGLEIAMWYFGALGEGSSSAS